MKSWLQQKFTSWRYLGYDKDTLASYEMQIAEDNLKVFTGALAVAGIITFVEVLVVSIVAFSGKGVTESLWRTERLLIIAMILLLAIGFTYAIAGKKGNKIRCSRIFTTIFLSLWSGLYIFIGTYIDSEDYTFLGWSVNKSALTPEYKDQDQVLNLATGAENDAAITLYAVWNTPSYTVSYDNNGGTDGIIPVTDRYKAETVVNILFDNIPTRTGYTFVGWSEKTEPALNDAGAYTDTVYELENALDYTQESGSSGSKYMELTSAITQNYIFYAVWKPNTYTVEFNANGGTGTMGLGESSDQNNLNVTYDIKIQIPKNKFTGPSKSEADNKVFLGWGTAAEDTTPKFVDGQSVLNLRTGETDASSITLYAIWGDAPVYYLNYDANGGSWEQGAIPDATVGTSSGDGGTITAEIGFDSIPQRLGYIFIGWRNIDTLYQKALPAVDVIQTTNLTVDLTSSNVTVYAEWVKDTYTITFDGNNSTGSMNPQTINYDESTQLTSNGFSRTDYDFIGWSTALDGSVMYQDTQYVRNLPVDANGEITLYAVWEPVDKYSIIYNANGGNGVPVSEAVLTGKTIDLEFTSIPTRSGYTFVGWAASPNEAADSDQVYTSSGETKQLTMTANVYLYAVWTKNPTYTVTYDDNALQAVLEIPLDLNAYETGSTVEVNFGTKPYLKGYTFKGWSTKANPTEGDTIYTEEGEVSFAISNDITFYAVWSPYAYMITYHDGEVTTEPVNCQYGTQVILKKGAELTARPGYEFTGWAIMEDSDAEYKVKTDGTMDPVDSLSESDGASIQLYAVWSPVTTEVILDNAGGSGGSNSVTGTYNENLPGRNLTSPTKKGYIFQGYYDGKNGAGTQYYSEDMVPMNLWNKTEDTTLYAKWAAVSYNLIYVQNGQEIMRQSVKYDAAFSLYNEEYAVGQGMIVDPLLTFLGWTKTQDAIRIDYEAGASITENALYDDGKNIILYPVIRRDEAFKVIYDANGGTNNGTVTKSYKMEEIVKIDFEHVPTKTGYIFQGWSTSTDGSDEVLYKADGETEFVMGSGEVTLYAIWKEGTFTVKYNVNGGSITESDLFGMFGEQEISYIGCQNHKFLDEEGLTKKGYVLQGWSLSKNNNGAAQYDLAETMTAPLAGVGESVVLYAVWKASTTEISFVSGAQTMSEKVSAVYGDKYGELPSLVKTGYAFDGWYEAQAEDGEGTGNKITASSIVQVTGEQTLYANWNVNAYVINYDSNGGTGTMENQNLNYDNLTSLTKNTFTRPYYDFVGWAVTPAGAVIYEDQQQVEMLADGNNQKVILYAVWQNVDTRVSFMDGTNTAADMKDCVYGDKYGELPVLAKDGYIFEGWYDKAEEGTKITAGSTVEVQNAQTLYAYWTPITYLVSYDSNGGTGIMADQNVTYDDQTAQFTTNTFEKTGCTFAGWAVKTSGAAVYGDAVAIPNLTKTNGQTITLYAVWSTITTDVSFESDGTRLADTLNCAYKGKYGELPVISKTGYTFNGWYTDADPQKGNRITASSTVEVRGTQTLYASWTPITYKLSFDGNGGVGEMADQTLTYDQVSAITANTFTKAGAEFAGWAAKTSGAVKYPNSEEVKNLTETKDQSITLYAVWSDVTTEVSFVNGTETLDEKVICVLTGKYGELPTVTKTGYTFNGWYTDADPQKGSRITANSTVEVRGTQTLYASWTSNQYELVFNANGGKGEMDSQTVIYDETVSIVKNRFSKAGCSFIGWAVKSAEEAVYADEESITNLAAVDGQKIELYAVWSGNDITVSFDTNGGEVEADQKTGIAVYNDRYHTLPIPVRAGYNFSGWYLYSDLTGAPVTADTAVTKTADHTLYAKWDAIHYSINYDKNASDAVGDTMTTHTFVYDQVRTLEKNTYSREYYIFGGWCTSRDGYEFQVVNGTKELKPVAKTEADGTAIARILQNQEELYKGTSLSESDQENPITLYAIWIPTKLSLTYVSNGGSEVSGVDCWYQLPFAKYYENAELPKPTRRGYDFSGWFADKELKNEVDADTPVGAIEDQILYAKWTITPEETARLDELKKQEEVQQAITEAKAGTEYLESVKKTITSSNTDKGDPSGSSFATLRLKGIGGNQKINLTWNKVEGTQKYIIYGAACGSKMKQLTTVSSSKKSYAVKKIGKTKLKKGKYYKFVVVASKTVAGEKRSISVSKTVHVCTTGGKKGNPKKVTYSKSTVTLKKGKSTTLKPGIQTTKKNTSIHVAKFRYESTNKKIATVSSKGKIKGVKKGSCSIYIYSQNGFYKKIKVKVK